MPPWPATPMVTLKSLAFIKDKSFPLLGTAAPIAFTRTAGGLALTCPAWIPSKASEAAIALGIESL